MDIADRAMVDFLFRSGETNVAMLALAMLTSHQAGRGLTSLKLEDLNVARALFGVAAVGAKS